MCVKVSTRSGGLPNGTPFQGIYRPIARCIFTYAVGRGRNAGAYSRDLYVCITKARLSSPSRVKVAVAHYPADVRTPAGYEF
jgi:hypothetical protein